MARDERAKLRPLMASPAEVADLLGVSRTRVYELMNRRELKSARMGKVRRIFMTSVEEYVARLESVA